MAESELIPDWSEVTEDDFAEPLDAGIEHDASVKDVEDVEDGDGA